MRVVLAKVVAVVAAAGKEAHRITARGKSPDRVFTLRIAEGGVIEEGRVGRRRVDADALDRISVPVAESDHAGDRPAEHKPRVYVGLCGAEACPDQACLGLGSAG